MAAPLTMQQIGELLSAARTAPIAARAAQQGNVGGYLSLANTANNLANIAGYRNQNINTGLGTANSLYGLYGGIQRGGVGGTLQAANSANALANRAGFGNTAVNKGLGGINSAYQIYNAIKNPTAGNVISGLAGVNKLGGMATGNSAGLLGGATGSALGAAGAGLGIYNAVKNPTVGNVASGLYDAYKLYGIGQSAGLWGGGAAASGAAGAGTGAAAGSAAGAGAAGTGTGIGGASGAAAAAIPAAAIGAVLALTNNIDKHTRDGMSAQQWANIDAGMTNDPTGRAGNLNDSPLAKKYQTSDLKDPTNPWNQKLREMYWRGLNDTGSFSAVDFQHTKDLMAKYGISFTPEEMLSYGKLRAGIPVKPIGMIPKQKV